MKGNDKSPHRPNKLKDFPCSLKRNQATSCLNRLFSAFITSVTIASCRFVAYICARFLFKPDNLLLFQPFLWAAPEKKYSQDKTYTLD